jgi:hypothetical protein
LVAVYRLEVEVSMTATISGGTISGAESGGTAYGETAYGESLSTPFSGLATADAGEIPQEQEAQATLEAPFAGFAGFATEGPDREQEAQVDFLESLHDEEFTEALAELVDEAAAQQLAEQGAWSGRLGEGETYASLEHWIEPLAEASEAAIATFAEQLEAARPETLSGAQLDSLLEGLVEAAPSMGSEVFEQFLGGLLKKVGRFAGRALKAIGKIIPIGALLKKLGGLVRPLIKRVLTMAIGKLPAAVRPLAIGLAKKLGIGEAEVEAQLDEVAALSEAFDQEVTALLAADGSEAWGSEAWGSEAEAGERSDPVGDLDRGRARLAQQLASLPPGATGEPEIEQFVPLVLAIRPLIKLAMSIVGRDKIVAFLGKGVAFFLAPIITQRMAKVLGPVMADVGLRVFGFEHAPGQEAMSGEAMEGEVLSGEALASIVEGTVLRTLDLLPAEALADELAVSAAMQTAFAEAAAAYLPDQLLRPDFAERETAGEGGVWVLMPRRARPHRFRKYTRVFLVPVTRQTARSVRWSDGSTLEGRLLDGGITRWPVSAEVHLYEALPGTHFGHLTQDETVPEAERVDSGEYQLLTPEVAGLLLGEPGLGRRANGAAYSSGLPALRTMGGATALGRMRPVPGQRYFRVRPVGAPRGRAVARGRRRVLVGLDLPRGRMRIAVRLSERQAQQVLAKLHPAQRGARRDLAGVLAAVRGLYAPLLSGILVTRLMRRRLLPDAASAGAAADRVTAAVTAALSAFLTERSAALADAVRDPAAGITLTVTFAGVTRTGLGQPMRHGKVSVRPGWRTHV